VGFVHPCSLQSSVLREIPIEIMFHIVHTYKLASDFSGDELGKNPVFIFRLIMILL
jgi:hypothetical protein